MDFKNTLLMPKTEFPMKGNLPIKEPKLQEFWQNSNLYEKVQKKNESSPLFVLHDGPPYANGDLHMGHALNKVLKDFIVRYRSMTGWNAPYVPGWDTHGLPIETALIKKGKIKRKEISVADFRSHCKEYALTQIDRQREQFMRLAILGDWENPYITLLPEFEAEQIGVFGEMAKKGYIYKGKKPVNWSPSSESALAEAEIEYHDKCSSSIYVAFAVVQGNKLIPEGSKFIIWTTTAWTIPANLGISVNANLDYVLVEVEASQKFVIAKDLLENVSTKLSWQNYKVLKTMSGCELENILAKHPLYDRTSLVMCGDHVTTEAGTGCVHTAPGHGEDDFIIGQRYGLDILCPVDEKGYMTDEAPDFTGLFYEEASKKIIEELRKNSSLLAEETITHSYPHDWRAKKPTIFRATSQWFASIKDFREKLLQAISETTFTPSWGQTRLHNMISARGDWCISRQRAWGVPIPVFYGEDKTAIINDETISHVKELFKKHGSNCWFTLSAKELLPEGFTHSSSPNGIFTKEADIMDVWFDSGTTHQGVLEKRSDLKRPADLYLEGSDQYRGWFNSSLSTSVAVTGKAPYKAILSHGFVLDGNGLKMSKSLGNIMLPEKIANQYGVDILRLWVASVDYQADVRVSDEIIKQIAEAYRKIRNTFRFLLGNLSDFDETSAVPFADLADLHKFMLVKLNNVIEVTKKAYESYEFSTIFNTVNNFCANELSAFYFDYAKDILYCDKKDSRNRRSIQTVLKQCLDKLVRILAPILPHTAEEIWHLIKGENDYFSVHLLDFPEVVTFDLQEQLLSKWASFLSFRTDLLKSLEVARNEKIIGKSLNAHAICYVDDVLLEILQNSEVSLEQLFIVSKVVLAPLALAPADAMRFSTHAIVIKKATGNTCERCWNISEEVGEYGEFAKVCKRCADVLERLSGNL